MRSDWGAKPGHEALKCHQRAWVLFHVKDSAHWTLELMLSDTSLNDPTSLLCLGEQSVWPDVVHTPSPPLTVSVDLVCPGYPLQL